MAGFCYKCGVKLKDTSKFCPNCGTPVRHREFVQQTQQLRQREGYVPYQQMYPSQYSQNNTIKQQNFPKNKTSAGYVTLVIALSVLLVIEVAFAAFKYPGFLNPQSGNEKGNGTELSSDTDSSSIMNIGSTSDISVTYTARDRESAPKASSAVSPEQPVITCGDCKIDFSYNLEGEDTLTVTALPLRRDEAAGYSVKAYDFSLASGQNEFPTDVVITVPRDSDDNDTTYWASFNEETGKWERIYSELSDDGGSYIVYTDHFSDKAKISVLNEIYSKLTGVMNGDTKSYRTAAGYLKGLFYYMDTDDPDYRNDYIYMLRIEEILKNLEPDCITTVDELASVIERTPKDRWAYSSPMKSLFGFNEDPNFGITELDLGISTNNLISLGLKSLEKANAMDKTVENLNKLGVEMEASGTFAKSVGPIAFLWSAVTLCDKYNHEFSEGKSLTQAFDENKLDTISAGVAFAGLTATAFSAPYIAAGCTIAGIGLYAASVYNDYNSNRKLSVSESAYRDYFTRDNGINRRIYYMEIPENTADGKVFGKMDKLESLDPDDDEYLQKVINRMYGLTAYNPRGISVSSSYSKDSSLNREWAVILKALYHISEGNPDKLAEIVKEFYTSYASAIRNDEKTFKQIDAEYRTRKGYGEDALHVLTEFDLQDFIDNYVAEIMKAHAPLILDMNNTYLNAGKAGFAEEAVKRLQKLMNTKMVFRVTDKSTYNMDNDLGFKGSVYAVDYTTVPGNEGGEKNGYSNYKLPMRFENSAYEIKGPLFLPNLHRLNDDTLIQADKQAYYPYSDNFIPRYTERRGNTVFTCSFYHYLVMGAPDTMVFRNVYDADSGEKSVKFTVPSPDETGCINVMIDVDPSYQNELSGFIGTWEGKRERGLSMGGTVTNQWVEKLKLVVEPSDGGGVKFTLYVDSSDELDVSSSSIKLEPNGKNYKFSGSTVTILSKDSISGYTYKFTLNGGSITMTEPTSTWDVDAQDFVSCDVSYTLTKSD